MLIKFTKMQGLGNDFMVIDVINQSVSLSKTQIKQLSDRHLGVGFDQLLLVESPENKENDFKYRIFNADGSEVEQCGNGARCLARFVIEKSLTKKTAITESAAFKYSVKNTILVETKKGVIRVAVAMSGIFVDMGKAIWKPKDIPFNQLKNENATHTVNGYQVGVVSMGNPHAVLIVDDINQEIESIAKKIQNSGDFPDGVNVSFVQITHEFKVKLRVYERGVGETLACGSGACATVAYLDLIGRVNAKDKDIIVDLKGGVLSIGVNEGDRILMYGHAEFVFEGQVKV